jgi:hypothetical protein
VKEVKPLEHGGNVKTITMKGVKHYTESGEYNGPTHKMPGNKVHTGKEHSEGSKPVSHKPGGPFKLREVHYDSPVKCWASHERKPGTTKGAKGSCQHKNPAKRPK